MVMSRDAPTNITNALLIVEPTDSTVAAYVLPRADTRGFIGL